MADPTVIDCAAACTVTVVHELAIPALSLTVDEAGQIGVAILVVWAVAYGFRLLIKTLGVADRETDTE